MLELTESGWRRTAALFLLTLHLAACDPSPEAIPAAGAASGFDGYRLAVMIENLDYARINGGTLFTIRTPEGRTVASAGFLRTWNSYCANDNRELHVFTRAVDDLQYTIEVLPKPEPSLKTGYAFVWDGQLFLADTGNGLQYSVKLDDDASADDASVRYSYASTQCAPFVAGGRRYESALGVIRACKLSAEEDCDSIAIEPTTFPYVYAEANGRVVAVTNWGDALIHSEEGWCRAEYDNDWFACPPSGGAVLPIPTSLRTLQFYSSTRYADKTYLGRWPDGRLYEFDGYSISVSADSPPEAYSFGSEAQSLASYCGDLFVGRWPRGTVWRRDVETKTWNLLHRLFTHPVDLQPWIPYTGQEPTGMARGFLGQRVTALIPFGDSLIASTANLRSWSAQVDDPTFLTPEQIAEYGAIHRIRRPGCLTVMSPNSSSSFILVFEFTRETIRVRHNGMILAEALANGVIPTASDVVSLGEGIFGTLPPVVTRAWVQPPSVPREPR